MNASQLQSKTINLSANSQIMFVMKDGTILRCIATKEIPNIAEDSDGKMEVGGPSTLAFVLDDPANPQSPVEKIASAKIRGTGV